MDVPTQLVLEAHITAKTLKFRVWPYDLLSNWTGESEPTCRRAMERDEKNGFLEYGVSLRTAWVTPKGYKYLQDRQ